MKDNYHKMKNKKDIQKPNVNIRINRYKIAFDKYSQDKYNMGKENNSKIIPVIE